MEQYKVIIVGAGPAGISTALHLVKLNKTIKDQILILDKNTHPREKICAGGVTGHAQRGLYEMGINFSQMDIPKVTTDVWRFRLGNEYKDTYESGFCTVVRRNEFDKALADNAKKRGIQIKENEEVIDLVQVNNGVKVTTNKSEYLAEVIVAADGVGSTVRQKLVAKNEEYHFSRLHLIETPVNEKENSEFQTGAVSFDMTHVTEGLQGYVWDFPCYIDGKPYMSRGIVDHNPDPKTRVDILAIFKKAMEKRNVNLDDYKLKSWPEIQFNPQAKLSAERVLLIGDAAGIDPLMGEGLSQSFNYGKYAAHFIMEAFQSGDFSFADYNQKLSETPFAKEIMVCTMLAHNTYRENPIFWLSLLWKDADFHKLIVGGFGGHIYMHQVPQAVLEQKGKMHLEQGDFSLPEGVILPQQ